MASNHDDLRKQQTTAFLRIVQSSTVVSWFHPLIKLLTQRNGKDSPIHSTLSSNWLIHVCVRTMYLQGSDRPCTWPLPLTNFFLLTGRTLTARGSHSHPVGPTRMDGSPRAVSVRSVSKKIIASASKSHSLDNRPSSLPLSF